MARQFGNSLFGSLRGKIWISTSVLAFFICTFGLISYFVVSLLVNDAFYGVFIPFLLLAFMVMIFGWWLSNEVVNPVERVILLAKSLERSTSTSLPRTSGSTETDQLLETIQRNNQQVQTIVTLMDKVANGNLDVAPLEGSDRLSTSFQKLLMKVSESIHAKEELEELKNAVTDLKMDVSGVRSGNLDAMIRGEYAQTREIAETIKYLIDNMSRLITTVRDGAESTEKTIQRIDEEIQTLIQRDEVRVQDMSQASIALKQVPNLINKITEDLMGSAKSARQSIEKARHGTETANQNSNSVSALRKQIREDIKRIQNLNERSHDIEKVAKTVEDLASRTNMIALNASIQATEMGEEGHGFVLVAEEVERLAARANGTNKQISTLNKSILAEIGKVESSVEMTMTEVASLSKYAIETGNVLSEMERYVAHFLNLQENLIAYSKEQSEETDEAFRTFSESISETESTIVTLRDSSAELSAVARLVRDLNLSVGEFRLPEEMPFFSSKGPDDDEPDAFCEETEETELYDEFANREFVGQAPGSFQTESESETPGSFQTESDTDAPGFSLKEFDSEAPGSTQTESDSEAPGFTQTESDSEAPGSTQTEFEIEVLNSSQTEASEFDGMSDSKVDIEKDHPFADETHEPDAIEAVIPTEPDVQQSGETGLNLLEIGYESETLDLNNEESGHESGESQKDEFDQEEYPMQYNGSVVTEIEVSDDTNENGVKDLYDASFNAKSEHETFDSSEFAMDELIDASSPEDQSPAHTLNSSDATFIDADEIRDILETGVFDKPSNDFDSASADNDFAL